MKWTFKLFIDDSGRKPVEDWISGQNAVVEEKIRAMIRRMSVTEKWDRPFFAPVKGHKNIFEIIIKADKQYRALGCLGPGPQVFTLLIGATKESKKRKTIWNPLRALEIADSRRELVFRDNRRHTCEY